MKKLKLKALELGARELLSREQLKNVVGGSYGSEIGSEEEGSYGEGSDNPKVTACNGKSEGDYCQWDWKGKTYSGKCWAFAPNYIKHCSDLN